MMEGLGLDRPVWLWALVLVPVLVLLAVRAERLRAQDISKLLATRLAAQLTAGVSPRLRWTRVALVCLALAAGVVALAGPHAGYRIRETRTTGHDVILAVDVSRSMLAGDLQPNRLVRAQLLADDIVRQLPGDRIGVVAFAGSAFLQAPLTVDHGAVLESVQALDTKVIPRGGSNLAQAIRTAVEAFGKGESSHRVLVILSDGEELDADALPAAREAAEAGIRIDTVGIGTANGSLIPVPAEGGGTTFVKDASGRLVTSRLDESRLREIAKIGGGRYDNLAANSGVGREIAASIRALEAGDAGSEITREPLTRYQWPLGLAVAALLGLLLLPERPGKTGGARSGRSAIHVAVVLLALAAPDGLHADDDPHDAFAAGEFDKAYEGFAARADKSSSPWEAYNAGTAALKANRYDDAIARFGQSMADSDPTIQSRAAYNLALALASKASAQSDPGSAIPLLRDAIEHFRKAEDDSSVSADASFNRKAAEQWLKELERLKQQQEQKDQQQKKQQQNKNRQGGESDQQQNEQQEQQGGQQDSKGEEGQQQEQQNGGKEQQGQQGGQKEDQQGQAENAQEPGEQSEQSGESQPEDGEPRSGGQEDRQQQDAGAQPGSESVQPAPTPVPGQHEGTLEGEMAQREPTGSENDTRTASAAQSDGKEVTDGRMTAAQARAILESLRGDERRVLLFDRESRQQLPTDKDW